jgi:hypothetical protein
MRIEFVIDSSLFGVPEGFAEQYSKLVAEALKKNKGLLRVTIEPLPRSRTVRENAYFHVLCGRLASMTGASKEQVKRMAKKRAVELGYPMATDENGWPIEDEDGFEGLPSSECSVEQFALLIEAVKGIAAEHGYYLED